METKDKTLRPDYYGGEDNPYEVFKVVEAWGLWNDAALFNVIKYVARAGKKSRDTVIQDLKKAQVYLQKKIEFLEKEKAEADKLNEKRMMEAAERFAAQLQKLSTAITGKDLNFA